MNVKPLKPDPGDELVDVLDNGGAVVSMATRREIRARRLPHRCTYVLVFNVDGQLLIHRRTATKDVFPGFWDVAVGGVLASGEEWHAGARREAAEELGVQLEPAFLFDFQYRDERIIAFGRVYGAVHSGPFRLQADEVVEAAFITRADLPTLFSERQFCPDGIAAWNEFTQRFTV